MKIRNLAAGLLAILVLSTATACGGDSFSLVGVWRDVDGTTRTVNPDGTCYNFEKVDIGGARATCQLGSSPDSAGYYTLFVQQGGMNQMNWWAKPDGNDRVTIYASKGSAPIYQLTRQ